MINKNNFIRRLFPFIVVFSLLIFLSSCNYHQHTFSDKWSYDETNHWHEATCEHKDIKDNLEVHTFSEWKIKSCPTCTEKGYEYRICKCGYEEIREKCPELGHNYESEWTFDNMSHWHKCKNCNEIINKEDHIFGEWIIINEATDTLAGSKEKICSICGYKHCEEIPMIVHNFDNKWTYDATDHWHACKDCDEVKDKAEHTYGDWYISKEPTESNYGQKSRKCTVCGQIESVTTPKLEHDFNEEWTTNATMHWHTCNNCNDVKDKGYHSYGDWIIDKEATTTEVGKKHKNCTICGYEVSEDIPIIQHEFNSKWSYDAYNHFHSCKNCDEVKDVAPHVYSEYVIVKEPTLTSTGMKEKTCTICGQKHSETIPRLS